MNVDKIRNLLAHPVQVGVGVIIGFITLVFIVAGTYIAYYPKPSPPAHVEKKALELSVVKIVDVDDLVQQAEITNYAPSHTYIVDYILANTGDIPVTANDFFESLTVSAKPPDEISKVTSKVGQDDKGYSTWAMSDKKRWIMQPVLLNAGAQVPFTVSLISNAKAQDILGAPDKYIKFHYQIVGVSDIGRRNDTFNQIDPFLQGYLSLLNDQTPLIRLTFLGGYIYFKGEGVWQFLSMAIVLFGASLLLLKRRYSESCVFDGYVIMHILLLLLFSVDIAEIAICGYTLGIKNLVLMCYPAIACYVAYILYLWFFKVSAVKASSQPVTVSTTVDHPSTLAE